MNGEYIGIDLKKTYQSIRSFVLKKNENH